MKQNLDKKKPEIDITMLDVLSIFNEEFVDIHIILNSNVFCPKCFEVKQESVGMKVENIKLNHLNDIIFRGKCKGCGNIVANYYESGEDELYFDRAERVRLEKSRR